MASDQVSLSPYAKMAEGATFLYVREAEGKLVDWNADGIMGLAPEPA